MRPPAWGGGETTDPDKRAVLPYVMPTANAKRSITNEDTSVPDYVDEASIPQAQVGYEVDLDAETKAQAEEARRLAIEQGLLDEDGNPIPQEPDEDINPIHVVDGSLDVLDNFTQLMQGLFDFIYFIFVKPMQTGGIAITGLIVVFVLVFGQSAFYVRGYQVESLAAQQTFYGTLNAEKKVLEDLVALGADATMLESLWRVYANTPGEPDRMTNALRLLGQLDTTVKAVEHNEEAMVKAHKLHMARQRLARIRKTHRSYTDAMIAWEEAAYSSRGNLAVSFGMARGPE